jgi:excisionase family DNA binding protein
MPNQTAETPLDDNTPIAMLRAGQLLGAIKSIVSENLEECEGLRLPKLVKRSQLAEILQVTERTIYGLVADGLPIYMVGASQRFSVDEVFAWIRTRNLKPSPTPTLYKSRGNHA